MDSRRGYSHAYEFSAAKMEDINSRQKAYGRQRLLIFEMRTDFIMDDDENQETIWSERYDLSGLAVGCDAKDIGDIINWRLDEYWMSEEGMHNFCREAAAFGNRRAAQVTETCVAVIVHMEVVTVQQEWEAWEDAKRRAVLPQKMCPLHVWHVQTAVRTDMSYELMDFLFWLPRVRANSEEELGAGCRIFDNDRCLICRMRLFFLGAFITKLDCGCAFHSHCIIIILERNSRCPLCLIQVFDPSFLTAPPLEEWWWEDEELLKYGIRSY